VAKKDKVPSEASQKLKEAEKLVQQRQAQRAAGKTQVALGKFFKDFRAESKKIIWPDRKTVIKNTGIVLLMVAVVGVVVFGIDRGLLAVLQMLYSFAQGSGVEDAENIGDLLLGE